MSNGGVSNIGTIIWQSNVKETDWADVGNGK